MLTAAAVQVSAAVVYCLLAAGVVFGYAALKPVLIEQGVYRDRCTEHELKEGVRVCYEQEIRYGIPRRDCALAGMQRADVPQAQLYVHPGRSVH